MKSLVIAATADRGARLRAMLAGEGYDVDVRIPGDAPGAARSDEASEYMVVYVDLALGVEVIGRQCKTLLGAANRLPPLVAAVGAAMSFVEADALIAAGVSVYLGEESELLALRARFLRSVLDKRRQSVRDILEKEAGHLAMVEALEEGVVIHGDDGNITSANPAAARILGVPRQELVGRIWERWQVLRPDGTLLPTDEQPFRRALRTGEPVTGAVHGFRRADGEIVWVSLNVRSISTRRPSPTAMVTTFTDVTARRRAEDQSRALLERSPEAALIHRFDRTLWASGRWAALLGYDDRSALVGRSIYDYVAPHFRAIVAERIRRRSEGGEVVSMEQVLIRRDGTEVPVLIVGVPTLYEGEPALVTFARDLSEQRQLEAKVMAGDRLAALGRLAASVGHEINNPLAYVVGNVRNALEQLRSTVGVPAAVGELLHEALEGADRVREIVQDLRVFSAREGTELGPVDLHRVVDSCARMAASEIRHRARLVRRYGDIPPVRASAPRLSQVLLNLLVNAAQAIPEGNADANTITVATSLTADGCQVLIEVTDTGVGIAAEHLPHVFEPFFTSRADGGGTGLGLSISQTFVAAQGGEMEIESLVGRGTTVRVRLATASPEPIADGAGKQEDTRDARRRVLIVDDEVRLARSLGASLESLHDVTLASSGREALTRIDAGPPFDAIVCDLMMPEMSGIDLYEHLHEHAPAVARRMVFMTGGAFTPRAIQFLAQHDDEHIEKPFAIAALLAAIERAAQRTG